jgi:anti-anti-sigma factor
VGTLLDIEPTEEPRVFRISGELDLSNAGDLLETLVEPLRSGGDIRLDVSGLRFMDSSGVRAVVHISKTLEGRGRLVLLRPQAAVRRVLDLMGLRKLGALEIEDGEREREPDAEESVRSRPAHPSASSGLSLSTGIPRPPDTGGGRRDRRGTVSRFR